MLTTECQNYNCKIYNVNKYSTCIYVIAVLLSMSGQIS
jgi:hypothetical protein